MKRGVVITGMGVVSPIGNSVQDFRKSLRAGISGEGGITRFDCSRFPVKRVFEVKNFNPHFCGTHLLDPFIQYAIAAASEAIEGAGVRLDRIDPFRIGISISSSKGGMHTVDRLRPRFEAHPGALLATRLYTSAVPNFAAQWAARRWKIKGPAKCYIAACATGTVSIIEGVRMVQDGVVDYCIAGAGDASIVPLLLAGYKKMKALSSGHIRPFDARRDGFLVGEGAGIVFLETPESARARNAKIYGEVLGFRYGSDCFDPLLFDPKGDALERCLRGLLEENNLAVEDIGYVNLHGTGTRAGDLYETQQIKRAFGEKAYGIPMSSIKSMTGHLLGASGAVEFIAALIALEDQFIPPTIRLEKRDRACDLDYTPLRAREARPRKAISISMGFGGHIATVALGKV